MLRGADWWSDFAREVDFADPLFFSRSLFDVIVSLAKCVFIYVLAAVVRAAHMSAAHLWPTQVLPLGARRAEHNDHIRLSHHESAVLLQRSCELMRLKTSNIYAVSVV